MRKYKTDYDGLTARTYRLRPDTVAHIDEIAGVMGVAQSRLLDYLLRLALAEVEAGRWQVRRRPASYAIVEENEED